MAPTIEVSDKVLAGLDRLEIPYTLVTNPSERDSFYVPSIGLEVDRERTHFHKNWFEAHVALQKEGARMLNPIEFLEVLKYVKENEPDVYRAITEEGYSCRSEFIDAMPEIKRNELFLNFNHVYQNGVFVPQTSEILHPDTLIGHRSVGISLEGWLKKPTRQGLPSKEVKFGDLEYFAPNLNGHTVAGFHASNRGVCLTFSHASCYGDRHLGVRAAKQKE